MGTTGRRPGRERISPKVSVIVPTPSPAFGKVGLIKGEITMQEAVCLSEGSTSRVKPLEYSARALAALANRLIIQTYYNGGAGGSQESQGGLDNSNHNHHLCVLLI